jgi:Zn-dependent M28 family amino/carboxypeptidase
LADDALRGRATPSEELDRAAQYIAARFGDTGLLHLRGAPRYLQTFRCGGTDPSSNVVGMLPGRDPELRREAVLVTAHYDHLGESGDDESGDTIWNGANDNASGVSAMIGIAEAFARVMEPPKRSLVFVAFCGEEIGMRGSKHWIRDPLWPLADTTAVVNLEMVGRADAIDPPVVWITGHDLSTLPAAFHDEAEFVASSTIGDTEADTFDRSDNLPFAREGIVAHTFAAGRLDELYHSVGDEAASLDYQRMAIIVRALARGIHRVAESPAPPRWTAAGRAAGYAR